MTVTFDKAAIRTEGQEIWLALRLPYEARQEARKFVLGQKDRRYTAEIKEARKKRSLDANAKAWAMLRELSAAVDIPDVEIYRDIVRDVGPCKDFTLTPDEARTFRAAWERLGVGWPTEQLDYTQDGERVVIRAYYGSSTYNTKQMSALIDRIAQDCQAVGIETLSDRERSLLLEDWDHAQRDKSNDDPR